MKKPELMTSAASFALRSYSVIPLRLNKAPALTSWESNKTVPWTPEEVVNYWERNAKANIGILTGKISGITVIDIDLNKDTHASSVAFETFPPTYTVKTPTGGYHLYYQYAPVEQSVHSLEKYPDVDIKNDGGYVVAPPSFCDYIKHGIRYTGTYKIVLDIPPAPFPIHLFNALKKQKTPTPLAQKLNVSVGSQESRMTSLIGSLMRATPQDKWPTEVWNAALEVNKTYLPPIALEDMKRMFASIAKAESRQRISTTGTSEELDLITDKSVPVVSAENIYRIMMADPLLMSAVRFNIFTGLIECSFEHEGNRFDTYQRVDIIRIASYLSRTYPFLARVKSEICEEALVRLAHVRKMSPPISYLESLVWDKKPRLDTWLSDVYHAPQDEYHRAVGSNWLKGLVRRLVEPGCKFDYVLVIEGKQGIRKSTSLAVLGGPWYVETILAPDNKDFFMLFGGKAIVEFSEGETLSRTEAKRLKAIITIQSDKYRVPYERAPQEFPRQCVFAMTTNQEEYLKDETGNRRWLPVRCEGIADIDWLMANRDQLYAEAYYRVITKKETTYEFPDEETRRQQQMRQIGDPREELIYDWYFFKMTPVARNEGITIRQVYEQGIHGGVSFGARELTKMDQMVIGSLLRDVLMLDKRQTGSGQGRAMRWYPSEATLALAPKESEITPEQMAELNFTNHVPGKRHE